ncbi:hypothetical protein [Caldimonas brevitalea]|uniref:hypothetical protein n=1 Tax=Caldimonas brevitalea TaxID=413882 RepID=UPI0012F9F09F|nr:hypothetical protein [Caldimonas brevitalea]
MAILPTEASLISDATTNAQQKGNFSNWRNFCADLLGTDSSNKAAARTALGFSASGDAINVASLSSTGNVSAGGRVTGGVATVAFSATPTFNAAAVNTILFGTLTGNVTSSTISNLAQGQYVSIRFKQDATGGRTVVLPATAKVAGSVGLLANQVSYLNVTFNTADGRVEGAWTVLPA